MVRPTKKFTQPGQSSAPEAEPTRLHKDKYFETLEQRRSKYQGRATSSLPSAPRGDSVEEPAIDIVIDLRDDSAYADESRGPHYYLRHSSPSD